MLGEDGCKRRGDPLIAKAWPATEGPDGSAALMGGMLPRGRPRRLPRPALRLVGVVSEVAWMVDL